jgi:DNA (cytosine-5)-methyltransferase 1
MTVTTEKLEQLIAQYLKNADIDDISKKVFPAALTHWAQNPKVKPPLVTKSHVEEFLRYVSEELGVAADQLEIKAPFAPVKKPKFTFIDLFAGIGGFRMALQDLGGQCVFSSDWDKEAQRTYFRNFGEYPYGDIRLFTDPDNDDEFINNNIPDHDILCAGFPCQPFSRAGVSARNALGKSHGFLDENQGNLFFDIVRIVEVKRPKVLFLENVKNLRSHDGGNTFAVIKKTIEELGYSFNPAVINANTVVPQGRQRCYMVCFRNGYEFEFPEFTGEPKKLKSILEDNVDPKYTISDRLWEGHQNRTKRNLERGVGFTAFLADLEKPANTLVARYYKDGKECLVPQEGDNPRKLTERECARLMGFPDNYLVSDKRSSAYKQFGNSLVMPVVKKIATSIVPELKNIKGE